MLLISLELENIRSYRAAMVRFPKGRMLLSGDIGSGKSTILLAIEFALFGLVRGWNDGEKLVRHGASTARVRLEADIGGPIVIERSLKRSASGIQQEEALIIEERIERRVTPSEARSIVISRLGYPEEFMTKQPMLFRYTVFTPQETMRQIIEERSEVRLAAIRTIFGIDRYESIASNAQVVSRSLKHSSALLSGRLERKQVVIEELSQLRRDERSLTQEREASRKALERANARFETTKAHLDECRHAMERERARRTERERMLAERTELERELESLIAERSELIIEQVEVPDIAAIESRTEAVETAISSLDAAIERVRSERTEAVKRIALLEAERASNDRSITDIRATQLERAEELGRLTRELERFERFDPDAVRSRIEHLASSIAETRDERTRLLERIRSSTERIESIPQDVCPTCGQKVGESHRKSAISTIRSSAAAAQEDVVRSERRMKDLEEERAQLEERLATYASLEQRRGSLPHDRSAELEDLVKTARRIASDHDALTEKRNRCDEQLETMLDDRAGKVSERDALRKKLKRAQQLRIRAEQAKHASERAAQIAQRTEQVRMRITRITEGLPSLDPEVSERFEAARIAHEASEKERSVCSARHERLEERTRSLTERAARYSDELSQLKQVELSRSRIEEVISFLSQQVPDLTDRIETAIMRRILIETNDHFSKWFSLLVDDLEGYLDDRFTPRILQSGYDVSFANLSGGERTSVALAFRLALHEAINHLTGQSSSGLLILDEPTDGFSSQQLDAVRTVLLQLRSEQVIIVSHEPVVEGFVDSVIKVEKRADRSEII